VAFRITTFKMNKIALILITITFSTSLQTQQTFIKVQREVEHSVVRFFETISNHDSVSLKTYCTSDISLYKNGHLL
jgi:hypothetical protein